jgi:hypothetical protein
MFMDALNTTRICKQGHTAVRLLSALWLGLSLLAAPQTVTAGYAVQVGAFSNPTNAQRFSGDLERQGFPTVTASHRSGAKPLLLVQVGPYPDRDTAKRAHERLDSHGVSGYLVAANTEAEPAPGGIDDLFLMAPDESPASDDKAGTDKYNFRGFFNSKYAHTYSSPSHPSMFRNTLELQASDRINQNVSWKVSVRGSYDAVFDLDNFYSDSVEDNRRLEGALHETYLDISAGDLEFRLGRQHIIWGEMVGLFFADVVSAKDMRQFVAEDFDLIRIPQWAARAEYFKGDFHTEAIWIPYMTYDEIGKPGDDFYPLGTEPPPGVDELVIMGDDEPSQKLSNSAFGLRLSMLKQGWDISGFYYRSMDASPAFFSTLETGTTTRLIITPRHDRIHQLGATVAKDFGNILLKGEAVYTRDRWFIVDNPLDPDGATQQDTLDYVVGIEHSYTNGTLLNVQLFQRWYTDHDSDILFDELETGISLYASKEIASRVDAELLLVTSLNRSDWMARPKVTWEMSDNWWLAVGADIFGGESSALFGRFDDSDRVYGNVRYTF